MQDESNNQDLISIKNKRLKSLIKKYEAASQQLEETLNNIDKISIKEQLKELELEIEQLQAEIDNLKFRSHEIDSSKFHSQYSRKWEEKFPEIDFKKSNEILKYTLDKFEDQEGAALFLLQNSRYMGGCWCIENIKSQFRNDNWYSPCKFEFSSHQEANPRDFLRYLAEKFSVPTCDELPKHTNEIISKICKSLRSGNILFIQIDIYDLSSQDTFLDWFVQQFWCILVDKLPEISQENPFIKLIAVLSIRGSIPEDLLLSDLCCESNEFDSKKILELPLEKWTDQEIKKWLLRFSGLTADHIGVNRQEIEGMAKRIHRLTEGRPSDVYSELMDAMSKRVNLLKK